jgi:hypothetical protein
MAREGTTRAQEPRGGEVDRAGDEMAGSRKGLEVALRGGRVPVVCLESSV